MAISHGAVIRAWVAARAENIDVHCARGHALTNTGIVTLDGGDPEGWRVLSWLDRSGAEPPLSGLQDAGELDPAARRGSP
jgi:hypothetical protein